jgi:hypothetical protein
MPHWLTYNAFVFGQMDPDFELDIRDDEEELFKLGQLEHIFVGKSACSVLNKSATLSAYNSFLLDYLGCCVPNFYVVIIH